MLRDIVFTLALVALAGCATAAQDTAMDASVPTAGSGRYPALMQVDPGLPTHTVYRPQNLAAAGRLPIVAFGNGGCIAMGNLYAPLLNEVASHGYLAIAIGPPADAGLMQRLTQMAPQLHLPAGGAAPSAPPAMPAGPPPLPPGVSRSEASALIVAVDWAIAENSRRGSRYYHRLATDQIALMGQSCGGVQVMAMNGDPRVKTSVMLNSGVFEPGSGPAMGTDSTALTHVHSPVLFLIGGPTDIAYPQATANFARLNVPEFMGNMNVGHGGTFREPNGGKFGQAVVQWLDWRLKGDANAARAFRGADCGLCRDPQWQVQRRNLD